MKPRRPQLRIGLSGWQYAPWVGSFYPEGLPARRQLAYVASRFNSLEINGTFYSLQRPSSFERWYAETPDDFLFALKGHRYITHRKQLREAATTLANFFASGVLLLRDKLGPILWQLPERARFDEARLAEFLATLPRDTRSAVALARRRERRIVERIAVPSSDGNHRLRHALEVRNQSFMTEPFIALLRRHGVALVFSDAPAWPYAEDLTADFIYIRLHGSRELYRSGYGPRALDRWAERVRQWLRGAAPGDAKLVARPAKPRRQGRDVFVYFDNDAKGHAPPNALDLARRVAPPRKTPRAGHGSSFN